MSKVVLVLFLIFGIPAGIAVADVNPITAVTQVLEATR